MSSIKQIQNRLLNKKNSLNKVNLNMATAEKGKNSIALRRLTQDKDVLNVDIKKLERQLIMEMKVSMEKKDNPDSQRF